MMNKLSYTKKNAIDDAIYNLIKEAGGKGDEKKIHDIILTALKLVQDKADVGDILLLDTALKEIRYAFKTFAPYRQVKKVSVFGSARTPEADPYYALAEEFSRRVVELGFMVITGGGGGIMAAAQKGAGADKSFGINITLPFEQRPNPTIEGDPKCFNFHYFFARKLFFIKETAAIAIFPGGFGSFDEGFEALTLLQTGKRSLIPVYFFELPEHPYWKDLIVFFQESLLKRGMISEEDFSLFKVVDDVESTALEVLRFYSNYHSMRFVGDTLIVRVKYPVSQRLLEELNDTFGDIVTKGKIRKVDPFPEEADEPVTLPFHRIALNFDRRSLGRLRKFIDRLNQ